MEFSSTVTPGRMVAAVLIQEGTTIIHKNIPADPDKSSEVGVERDKHPCALINLSANYFTQTFPYLVNIGGSVEHSGQLHSAGNDLKYLPILRVIERDGFPGTHSVKYISICFPH
jgi:hypothetical protein